MRAVITGTAVAYRQVDIKGSKLGQFDLIQFGSDRHPTKIVSVFVPSSAYIRLLLSNMMNGMQPIVSFMVWLTVGKELDIEVMELLSITPGGVNPGRDNTDTNADTNGDTDGNGNSGSDPGGLLVN